MPHKGAACFGATLALAAVAPFALSDDVKGGAKKDAPKDKGRELVLDICTTCHELDLLTGQSLTREQWTTVIKGMISEGTVVTDEEFSWIVDYLVKSFGPKEKK